MDSSPEQPSNPSNSTPPPLQESSLQDKESAVFSYVSSLSPIKPDKAGPVAQGFPGINSPPFAFRSPQTNAKPIFSKRPQFAGSSDAGLSGQNESCGDAVTTVEESAISSSHSTRGSRNCTQKTFITSNSAPEKASSPPGCADDCVTEIVNMDGGDSTSSLDLTPKSSNNFLHSQNDLSNTKVSVENIKDNDDVRKEEMKIAASPATLGQTEEENLRDSVSDVKSAVSDQKSGDCNMSPDLYPKIEPDKSADHALKNHQGGHLTAENAGSAHVFEVDCASLSESLQIAQDCGSCIENAGACTEAAKKKMHDQSPKVVQPQHGITRRLQFEDAQGKITSDGGVRKSSGSAVYPKSPASPADSEVLESASQNKLASPSNRLLANMTPPFFTPQNAANYNLKIPKRSGIGLHLNSIVNSMQMGSGAKVHVKSTELGSFDGLENSASSLSPYSMKSLNEAAALKPIELQSSPSNKRKSNSETSDSFEDFGQSSPRKKSQKRTFDTSDSNSCKRCNCKKTKCLKLYCDCFAAGIYCAECCACQGCFNRIEYEDTVLETKQQIESRNPLAFAPKITQRCNVPQRNVCVDDGAPFTPSSRHKRGCNCKKSKCLKKYCECYQANVGCSDKCRCEGCENIYGLKGEFGTKDLITKHSEKSESSFDMTQESVASKDGLVHNELYNPHNLTPLTPSFLSSDHGKGASKAWLSSGGYLQSPESGLNFTEPYGMSTRQATNPDNRDMVLQANTEVIDLVSFGQGLDYGYGYVMNQFSPGCDVPRNAGNSTVLPNPEDWATNSRAQFFSGNHQFSSPSSLRWDGSPITPSANFRENKLHKVVDSDDGLHSIMDDSTPEILKEAPVPADVLKVSSPNKKRVSPPHGRRELGSSSSAGLRTARKFILRAVPSFPPLTPCIDSKDVTSENNSQNSNSSK